MNGKLFEIERGELKCVLYKILFTPLLTARLRIWNNSYVSYDIFKWVYFCNIIYRSTINVSYPVRRPQDSNTSSPVQGTAPVKDTGPVLGWNFGRRITEENSFPGILELSPILMYQEQNKKISYEPIIFPDYSLTSYEVSNARDVFHFTRYCDWLLNVRCRDGR